MDALTDRCATEIVRLIAAGESVDCGSYNIGQEDFATYVSEMPEFGLMTRLALCDNPIGYGLWLQDHLSNYALEHAADLAAYRLAEEAEYAADTRAEFEREM